MVARAREKVRCDRNEDDISIEKVLHMFSKDSNIWQMSSVPYENLWHNNVRSVVRSQL